MSARERRPAGRLSLRTAWHALVVLLHLLHLVLFLMHALVHRRAECRLVGIDVRLLEILHGRWSILDVRRARRLRTARSLTGVATLVLAGHAGPRRTALLRRGGSNACEQRKSGGCCEQFFHERAPSFSFCGTLREQCPNNQPIPIAACSIANAGGR